jgi:outer membrane usher protein
MLVSAVPLGRRRRAALAVAISLPALLASLPVQAVAQTTSGAAPAEPSVSARPQPLTTAASAPAAHAPSPPTLSINPTGKTIDLVVPLRATTPLGQVAVRLTANNQVLVSATDLANAVTRIATPDALAAINGVTAIDGYIPLEALAQAGLNLTYDPAQLELVLNLSATAKIRGLINLGFQTESAAPLPDESASFAAYLSYTASLDYVHKSGSGPTGLRSPRVDMNLNGRIGNLFAFQNELSYDGNAATSFVRQGSRVIYDRPDWAMRFTLGDQLPVQTGFQDSTDVMGIGVAHRVEVFRPDQVLASSSSRSITLREGADVTVLINGVPTRTLHLDSGVYDLNDLPLTAGANSVQLVIEDAAGGRRVVAFDFFQDLQLLEPGVSEYDVQGGIRSHIDNLTRHYFTQEPSVTGYYRRGITEQMTLGANIQATSHAQQLGLEGTLGTPIGLFTLETAMSNIDGYGFGHAERLQYRYSTPLQQLQGERRIDLLVEHRSRNFGSVESFVPDNVTNWRLTARYAQPWSRKVSIGGGIDYDINRQERDRYGASVYATWRVGARTTLTSTAGYDNRDHAVFGFTFIHRFGRGSTLTGQYDSRDDQGSISYTHEPYRTLDTFAYNAQISRSHDDIGVNATGIYRSNRGDLELDHRATYDMGSNDITGEVTSLRARGTVAFAGGRVALGRYLTDSFAIVAADPSLNNAQVSAPIYLGDRLGGREIARTGALGPALVPVSSYAHQSLPFEVPDAPAGYDLGAGNFALYPWLDSGRVFVVGSEFNVTAVGTLLDERGQPMALLSGVARRLNDAKSRAVPVFTNRAGRFGATGLAPGTWRVSFADGHYYDIVITEAQGSLAKLGELRPTGLQEKAK